MPKSLFLLLSQFLGIGAYDKENFYRWGMYITTVITLLASIIYSPHNYLFMRMTSGTVTSLYLIFVMVLSNKLNLSTSFHVIVSLKALPFMHPTFA